MSSAIENACTPFFRSRMCVEDDDAEGDDEAGDGDGDDDGDLVTICSTLMSSRLSRRKPRICGVAEAFHYLRQRVRRGIGTLVKLSSN